MARVLFLFNHDAGHQVAHLASVVGAFARANRDIETIVGYGGQGIRKQIEELISPADAKIHWQELPLSKGARFLARTLDRFFPASRILRLRNNLDVFAGVDAIVSTERTCLLLQRRLSANRRPLFAIVPHGAGDRNVSFHPDFARFDRVLVAGPKVVDQLVDHGVLRDRIDVIGYPKFEGVDLSLKPDYFNNGRPTFVYNPHFDPHLSSWYREGPTLLRWFASEEGAQFNCIFAPHVMLFRKRWHISPEYRVVRRRPDVPQEAVRASNILIDVASPRLLDMSYMLGSDGYIGDVSSQIYEFLARPRPAFFIDCRRKADPESDRWLLFRKGGPVVRTALELPPLLARHAAIGQKYRAAQSDLFAYTFDVSDHPAGQRAAKAIGDMLTR